MNQCSNCGQVNNDGSNFCRFCGTRIPQSQMQQQSYEHNPPRPYAWKTDEFQASDQPRKKTGRINQVQPLPLQNTQTQRFTPPMMNNSQAMMTGYQQVPMSYGYRCPNCGTQNFPRIERRISTAGWILFAVLLVMFFPLFWIGLLVKEDIRVCPVCNIKLNF